MGLGGFGGTILTLFFPGEDTDEDDGEDGDTSAVSWSDELGSNLHCLTGLTGGFDMGRTTARLEGEGGICEEAVIIPEEAVIIPESCCSSMLFFLLPCPF